MRCLLTHTRTRTHTHTHTTWTLSKTMDGIRHMQSPEGQGWLLCVIEDINSPQECVKLNGWVVQRKEKFGQRREHR